MKKFYIILILVLFSLQIFAQNNNSFTLIASKVYPNDKITAYIKLDNVITTIQKQHVETEIIKNEKIFNFSFYDKNDLSKFMVTSDITFTVDSIVNRVNTILILHENEENKIPGQRFNNKKY